MRNYLLLTMTIVFFTACATGGGGESEEKKAEQPEMSAEDAVKFEQYMVAGETLYLQYCSQCHQPMGTGLSELYPPLKDSDYMENNFESVLCILRYGKTGEIVVNGKTYNQMMPAQPQLTDLEIAEIATYVYNSWGHNRGLIPVTEVTPVLNACEGAQ